MTARIVRLASLTVFNVTAIALFLILRLVDHYSFFTSMFITSLGFFGFSFAWILARKTAIEYEIMKEKQKLDKEAAGHG